MENSNYLSEWEYRVFELPEDFMKKDPEGIKFSRAETILNGLGTDFWEVVSTNFENGKLLVVAKRRKV